MKKLTMIDRFDILGCRVPAVNQGSVFNALTARVESGHGFSPKVYNVVTAKSNKALEKNSQCVTFATTQRSASFSLREITWVPSWIL